jgi:hypothetical protein
LNRFRRMSHQGDSGAKYTAKKIGIGKTHWRAKGMRYDQDVVLDIMPRRTMEAISWPRTQHALTHLKDW